jgi:hypothetical protein
MSLTNCNQLFRHHHILVSGFFAFCFLLFIANMSIARASSKIDICSYFFFIIIIITIIIITIRTLCPLANRLHVLWPCDSVSVDFVSHLDN